MSLLGARLAVQALEDEGCRRVFGIPGVHNLELWDALGASRQIEPVLAVDERGAAFMADGVSRSSSEVGVIALVPGPGVTHALSGIAEAFLDQTPLVVVACGVRADQGFSFQLHQMDQASLLKAATKAFLRPEGAGEIYPALRRAFALARGPVPGPVAVEIPANLLLARAGFSRPAQQGSGEAPAAPRTQDLDRAADILNASRRPFLYVGNGARAAGPDIVRLAEKLSAPVATTISGKGVFPEDHPLWLWNGLGAGAPPFARRLYQGCDALLAVACRFSEVATASYGFWSPAGLVHVDADPRVLNRNYPAQAAVVSDAAAFVAGLLPRIKERGRDLWLEAEIAAGHADVREEALEPGDGAKASPAAFFAALQDAAGPGAVYAVDSGNGCFLAMEHLRLKEGGRFLAPTDYSAMGYGVPAAIGAKLADPSRPAAAVVGDGAFLMTCMELLTASRLGAAPVVCVLRDGELGQIAQFQDMALGRRSCVDLAPYELGDMARALRCAYVRGLDPETLSLALRRAFEVAASGTPVVVEVSLDASRRTYFTQGVVRANFGRLSWAERLRAAGRLAARSLLPI